MRKAAVAVGTPAASRPPARSLRGLADVRSELSGELLALDNIAAGVEHAHEVGNAGSSGAGRRAGAGGDAEEQRDADPVATHRALGPPPRRSTPHRRGRADRGPGPSAKRVRRPASSTVNGCRAGTAHFRRTVATAGQRQGQQGRRQTTNFRWVMTGSWPGPCGFRRTPRQPGPVMSAFPVAAALLRCRCR